jgi:murein DD-endopeptidase MepM/ murein hydrolase activator NlpD
VSLVGSLALVCAIAAPQALASRADEIRSQIEEREQKIEELEQDIQRYESELTEISSRKQSLESAVSELEVAQQRLETDIAVTENRIDSSQLQIEKLSLDIDEKESAISTASAAISDTIRSIHEHDRQTLVETVLSHDSLSDAWTEMNSLQRFQVSLKQKLNELKQLRNELQSQRRELEDKRSQLVQYRRELAGQQEAVAANKEEKQQLLSRTENKQENYQTLLQEKRAARREFLNELSNLESQLDVVVDPNTIPPQGDGILKAPLDSLTITQYFGNTQFAQEGGYDGKGHNGVDFRAAPGTRVLSSLSGTVIGTGNTDRVNGCYSYGKWVLIEHNNGLSTLYAHLSVISVTEGEQVSTGDVIGFSGNTGYSTGPHLHYGVYASQGVEIRRLGDIKEITNCGPAYIPVAPHDAYLDPLGYL